MASVSDIKKYVNALLKDLKAESITVGTRKPGTSIGDFSVTSGPNNEASGRYSTAMGSNNEATKDSSAAFGEGTRAYSKFQLVHGRWNVDDSNDNYAHIVGGGTDPDRRKNIYTLDWEGNASFAGSIKTNVKPADNDDLVNLGHLNSNLAIKFFPGEVSKNGEDFYIYLNELEPFTEYKVKMDRDYRNIYFMVKAKNGNHLLLRSDLSINKYSMFVGDITPEDMYFNINAAMYHIIFNDDHRYIKIEDYTDPTFSKPGGSGSLESDMFINDNEISANKTWSSTKIYDFIKELRLLYSDDILGLYTLDGEEISKVAINTSNKLDKPVIDGEPGKYLTVDHNGDPVWSTIDLATEVSGDASNIDYNGTSVKDILDRLLYTAPSINFTATPAGGDYEMGRILTAPISLRWTNNKQDTVISQRISVIGSVPVYEVSADYPENISSNTKITLSVTDSVATYTKEIAYNFYYGVYCGGTNVPLEYNSEFVKTLNKHLSSNRNGTYVPTASDDQYIYYCCPSNWPDPVFTVGGFDGGFEKVAVIDYTNSYDFTYSYSIWKSDHTGLGTQTVVIKH